MPDDRTDDLGNDLQESEINLYQRYIDDPPEEELVIEEAEIGHELGISEEVAEEVPPSAADEEEEDEELPAPRESTESGALHVES
ncbi:hypothetical protein CDO52_17690 [Nocardiopsis gilva YIM 90087]|uniref:Uncharacterized protein n=1 Tax=Nocardiopsis gilva YIM 90087 TaxID=1235441 RepID=A0A223S8E4_9ACTN|nr:hypothetical protein [Nocardiopsis gilva]ASU84386.1 hypothetical protein CDO52_17690 [Nocardiopsis gilva YIM 90087]